MVANSVPCRETKTAQALHTASDVTYRESVRGGHVRTSFAKTADTIHTEGNALQLANINFLELLSTMDRQRSELKKSIENTPYNIPNAFVGPFR